MINWGVVAIEYGLLFAFTVGLLYEYASKTTHPVYLIAVAVSWYLGFFGTLLLPLDVEETLDGGDVTPLVSLWEFVYWSTFVLSWVILPVLQEFYASGEFSFGARLCKSLKSNIKFYIVVVGLLAVFIIWMMISKSWGFNKLFGFMIACANTYGMLLIVLMLGYGLVEVPRMFWHLSLPKERLVRLEFHAPDVEESLFDADGEITDVVDKIRQLGIPQAPTDPKQRELRAALNRIIKRLPRSALTTYDVAALGSTGSNTDVTLADLAKIHTKVIASVPNLQREQARWDTLLRRVAETEAIIDKTERPSEYDSAKPKLRIAICCQNAVWYFKSRMSWWAYKVIAVLAAIMSILVLWCEMAIPLPIDLSVFGLVVENAGTTFGKQFFCMLFFMYMCLCMYLALFHVKWFKAITLTPNHYSHAYALCFNASYLCRLQFVLAYNYLLALDLGDRPSAFHRSVGAHMDLVPIFGKDMMNFVPIFLIIFAACTFFRVVGKVLKKIGIEGFDTYRRGNAEHEEKVLEGRKFIRTGQQRLMRTAERARGNAMNLRAPVNPVLSSGVTPSPTSSSTTTAATRDAALTRHGAEPTSIGFGGYRSPNRFAGAGSTDVEDNPFLSTGSSQRGGTASGGLGGGLGWSRQPTDGRPSFDRL